MEQKPQTKKNPRAPVGERLIDSSRIGDGCWQWEGTKNAYGYGVIVVDGRKETAHRVSYRTFVGDIPQGLYVLHHCDNRSCIRPSHLYLGTHEDNMQDKKDRGRASNGGSPRKLSVEQVMEILSSTMTQAQLAKKYGVSQATISQIKTGNSWVFRLNKPTTS